MDYLIVSAATEGSRYVDCLNIQRKLLPAESFLPIIVPDRGSWAENTKLKPDAIREAFKVHDVVLWIDSDCKIDPPLAAPKGNWNICTAYNFHPRHRLKISAGYLMLRRCDEIMRFLDVWDRLNKQNKKDHPAMMDALAECRSILKMHDMTPWIKGRHVINGLAPERGAYKA